MPRKPRSPSDPYGLDDYIDPAPTDPEPLNEARIAELVQQAYAEYNRFQALVQGLPVDPQTKKALLDSVSEFANRMVNLYCFTNELHGDVSTRLIEALSPLLREVENRRKGTLTTHVRKEDRHEVIDQLIAKGYSRGDTKGIYRYLREHHPELIRKGQKDFIDPDIMMQTYRASKKQ